MSKRLEYIGKDVARRSQLDLLEAIRAQFPHLSEAGIHEMAKAELTRVAPRHSRFVEHLLGEDILTDDLTTIEAWPLMTGFVQRLLRSKTIEERRDLVDPKGLSKTYVWRKSNGWVQEVTDHDVDVIRNSEARNWFRDIDVFGPYDPVRSFNFPVADRVVFTDTREARRFEEEELTRKKQWSGA